MGDFEKYSISSIVVQILSIAADSNKCFAQIFGRKEHLWLLSGRMGGHLVTVELLGVGGYGCGFSVEQFT